MSEELLDLTKAEYAALKRAAAPSSDGILMFMANAALEKIAPSGGVTLKRAAKQPSCLSFYDGAVAQLTIHRPVKAPALVRVRVQTESPEVVIELKLDEWQSELIHQAAASARLSLKELLEFILLRQMEAFHPEDKCYTVCGNAQSEVSDALRTGEQFGTAIEAIAKFILESLSSPDLKTALHAQVSARTSLIREMAVRIGVSMADAQHHWCHAIVPALLERKSAPGAQAAA